MAQHARLANDRAWLLAHKKQILDGANWISRERLFQAGGPKSVRRLDPGQVCVRHAGRVGPRRRGYFTYTDAISFMDFTRRRVAQGMGQPEGDDILREAEAYRKDIIPAVDG